MEAVSGMISIDRWREASQAYFLTHLHSDHTGGLSPKWSRGPLYCSPISARLLPSRFPGFNLSLIRVLEVDTTYFIPLVSTTTGRRISVQVTSVDADHCPGSVMYLFKGEFGCMLHTGDFRWESSSKMMQNRRKILLEALSGDKVDLLYLDNTYCHPSFSFPSRDIAAQKVIDVINLHPIHDIVIGIDNLGKEELLLCIAQTLKTKIWVWPERLLTMHILGLKDIFTTKTSLTRIRAVPRYSLTVATLEALNKVQPTVGIMPSGLPWLINSTNQYISSVPSSFACSGSKPIAAMTSQLEISHLDTKNKGDKCIYNIPYSDHSCFSEIEEFVELVQPIKVTGIVSSSVCDANPDQNLRNRKGKKLLDGLNCDLGMNRVLGTTLIEQPQRFEKLKLQNGSGKKIHRASHSVVRWSRLSISRRGRRGAKLFETETESDLDHGIT